MAIKSNVTTAGSDGASIPTYPGDAAQYLDGTGSFSTPAGGGGGLTVTAVQVANYTAAVFEEVRYNPTGTFALTTPASPADGDLLSFHNIGALTAAVTITGNGGHTVGNPFHATPGTPAASYAVTLAYFQVTYRYYAASTAWLIV